MQPRKPPSSEEILREQEARANAARAAAVPPVNLPATTPAATGNGGNLPARYSDTPDEDFLNEIDSSDMPGTRIKLAQSGSFETPDGKAIEPTTQFIFLGSETLWGYLWLQKGEPPRRAMGLRSQGFIVPKEHELPDNDPATWPINDLSGKPQSPWQKHVYLVLQEVSSGALYTYDTSSWSGLKEAGRLLRHFDRLCKTHPDRLPVVRLTKGTGYRKETGAPYPKPVIVVDGTAPRTDAATPGPAVVKNEMDDQIPF